MKYFTLSPVRYRGTIRTTANGILIIFQLTNASGSGCCCISRTTAGDVIKTWDGNVSTAIRVFRDGRIKSWCFFFFTTRRAFISTVFEQRLISRGTNSGNCACTSLSARTYNCSTCSNWNDPPYDCWSWCDQFLILTDSIIEVRFTRIKCKSCFVPVWQSLRSEFIGIWISVNVVIEIQNLPALWVSIS